MEARKLIQILLSCALIGIPTVALAATGGDYGGDQPQILFLLDNSQGIAGVLHGVDGLSGAIMSGSGTVPEDQDTSSPVDYTPSANFTPPALAGSSVPYSVPCSNGMLSSLGQQACAQFGATGFSTAYVDNSESMFNAAENAIRSVLRSSYAQNDEFGLETYGLSNPGNGQPTISLYNTWVYYMSGPNGFSFGNSATAPSGLQSVLNPCYGSVQNGYFTNNSCEDIYFGMPKGYGYSGPPLIQESGLYSDKYLYIKSTSDQPDVNDVLYANASNRPGSGDTNAVGDGAQIFYNYQCGYFNCYYDYGTPSLANYEAQTTGVTFNNYSNSIASEMSPTSAGYYPNAPQVWESQRGFGFNANASGGNGEIDVQITSNDQKNNENIEKDIVPEVLGTSVSYGNTPITAAAGYSPMAGAFATAGTYLTGNSVPATCAKKYVIFITDGQPTMGLHGNVYPPLGSPSASLLGIKSIQSAADWQNTNDKAVTEAIQQIQQLHKEGITTFVVGVGSAVNPDASEVNDPALKAEATQANYVLQAMANAGNGGSGTLYTAESISSLTASLQSIVESISSETITARFSVQPSVVSGNYEFSTTDVSPSGGEGDLEAYQIMSAGELQKPASLTPIWDAESLMSTSSRQDALVTTEKPAVNGVSVGSESTLVSEASNQPSVFDQRTGSPSPATIAAYTINPFYDNGQYLGGRASGWYIGLSSDTSPVSFGAPDDANLFGDQGYLPWAGNHASREDTVLFSANDGLVYAIAYQDSSTPAPKLLWAWMPQGLLGDLQNYSTFWQSGSMIGSLSEVDAYNGSQWHSYVGGSAENGAIVFSLQLTGQTQANLGGTVAEYDLDTMTGGVWSQVAAGNPGLETDSNGESALVWSMNETVGGTTTSGLLFLNLGTGQLNWVPVSGTLTSEPVVGPHGTVYVAVGGNVETLSASIAQSLVGNGKTGQLVTDKETLSDIGDFANYPTGVSTSITRLQLAGLNGVEWMLSETSNGMTAAKNSNGAWVPQWATTANGSGTYDNGRFTPQSSSTPASQQIAALPATATITDAPLVAGSSVILPVSIPPSAGTCGLPTAEYYLYQLGNGAFPSGVFSDTNGQQVTGPIDVGYGTAYTPSLTSLNGRPLIQASASNTNSSKVFEATVTNGLPLGGPVQGRFVW